MILELALLFQVALGGATVTLSTGQSSVTDAQGYYSFQVPNCWTGRVTPKLSGFLFTPASSSRTCLGADFVADFVGNATDVTPPVVKVINPKNNASLLRQLVLIQATATDNRAVVGVRFLADGVALGGELQVGPYKTLWDARKTTAKSWHTITAIARDGAGNSATTSVRVRMR
jgi:hypothetical protein